MEITYAFAFAKEFAGCYLGPAVFVGFSGYTAYRSSKTRVTQDSRFWSTLSLVGVDINYSIRLADDLAKGDYNGVMLDVAGLSSILCVTARSFLMYHYDFSEMDSPEKKQLQQRIVWSCLGLATVLVIGGQLAGQVTFGHAFDWGVLWTLAGMCFGTRADGVNLPDPKRTNAWRRRYLLGMALCQIVFGWHTGSWALKSKATVDALMRVRYDPITVSALERAATFIRHREAVRLLIARTLQSATGKGVRLARELD
jgi:hypothetical protein